MFKLNRLFILLPILSLYLMAIVFVGMRSVYPSDGTRLWLREADRVEGSITILVLADHGLLEGDQIIGVQGISISEWATEILNPDTKTPGWRFGDTLRYTVSRNGQNFDVPVTLTYYPFEVIFHQNPGVMIFLVILQASAVWIFAQRPQKGTTQLLLLSASAMVTFSICWLFGMDLVSFLNIKGLWLFYRVSTFIMLMTMCSALLHFALLLPSPDTLKRGGPWLLPAIYLAPYPVYVLFLALMYQENTLEWIRTFEVGVQALIFVYFLLTLVVIIYDYQNAKNPTTKKSVQAVSLTFFVGGIVVVLFGWLPSLLVGQPLLGWNYLPLFALPIVIGMAISIVFYQLFNISIVIQRTLVWGALTMLVIVVYSLVVGTLSLLFQTSETTAIGLIGTGMVAVLFHPVRQQLQRTVNQLLYGERDNPYGVVSRLGKQLEAAIAPDAVLNTIVQTVAEALKLPYAAIELKQDETFVAVASYGIPAAKPVYFPLTDTHEIIGYLVVAPRGPHETFDAADKRLLKDLTRQARVAVMTVQLTRELQHSRERLVMAREEERRRLGRDLHDGIGPALASIPLHLDAARNLLKHDPSGADSVLANLKGQIQNMITDIRRMSYELRPPVLDEFGLISTIRTQIDQFNQINGLKISIEAPDTLPELPAAIEIAAYRITMEALTNVVRHAKAKTCQVQVMVEKELRLTIHDDGCGITADHRQGIGLSSMNERASELGGTCKVESHPGTGTTVRVCIPLTKGIE